MAPKKQPMTAAFLNGGNLAVAGAQWWNTRRLDGGGRGTLRRRSIESAICYCEASTTVRTMNAMPAPSWSACLRPDTS
jgi:hypothetical protein